MKPVLVCPRRTSRSAYSSSNPLVRWVFYERIRELHKNMIECNAHKGRVLDAGCGYGIFLPTLSKTFQEVFALDLPDRIGLLKPTISGILHDYECSNVVLVKGDIMNLLEIFPKDFFDCIVCADVLEHLEVPAKALFQFDQCLKSQGSLEFSIPTETRLYNFLRTLARFPRPSHYERYDFRRLLSEIAKMFEIRKLQSVPPLLSLFICGSACSR